MKSRYKVSLAAVLLGGGIVAGSLMNNSVDGASSSGQPGTADDPVVTKSYVDQKLLRPSKVEHQQVIRVVKRLVRLLQQQTLLLTQQRQELLVQEKLPHQSRQRL